MNKLKVSIAAALLISMGGVGAAIDFHITKGPAVGVDAGEVASITIERIILMPGQGSVFGGMLKDHIRGECKNGGYTRGAAYFDIQTGSSPMKSIQSGDALVVTYQCY